MISEKTLAEALAHNNQKFMEQMPQVKNPHGFSAGFEKRMKPYLKAQKKYGGRIWMERVVRYSSVAAAVVLCSVSINFISAKVFDVSIWKMITGHKSGYTQIAFEKDSTSKEQIHSERYEIAKIPEGYKIIENESGEERHQVLLRLDEQGSITYIEGNITEQVLIDIASENQHKEYVGDKEVFFDEKEDVLTAYFLDDQYYHLVTIQGQDASKKMVCEIIRNLKGVKADES